MVKNVVCLFVISYAKKDYLYSITLFALDTSHIFIIHLKKLIRDPSIGTLLFGGDERDMEEGTEHISCYLIYCFPISTSSAVTFSFECPLYLRSLELCLVRPPPIGAFISLMKSLTLFVFSMFSFCWLLCNDLHDILSWLKAFWFESNLVLLKLIDELIGLNEAAEFY